MFCLHVAKYISKEGNILAINGKIKMMNCKDILIHNRNSNSFYLGTGILFT